MTGAWNYYAHDKRTAQQQAQGQEVRSRERVGFVHTENLGGIEDDRAAIGLMIDTARRSRRCESRFMRFPWRGTRRRTPDQAHMIDSGREALKVLGMQDHQALMISHTDTAHPHVHVIVNRIHPETGLAAVLSYDQPKLQAWAFEYERRHGKVYCPAREFKALARQAAKEQDGRPPPRRYVDNMAVAPSGRAFAVLRELNKGLPKGQTIKGEAFDRQTADLQREDLRPVKEVQQEMERRARSRSGEKSRQQPRPRRAEPNKEQRQGQAQTADEGKKWALEMRIRAERRALDERQAQARER